MKKISAFFLLLILAVPTSILADAVYLKNGKVIEGEIISEKKYSIKIKVNNFPYTYYIEEIERIEKDSDAAGDDQPKTKTAAQERSASEIVAKIKKDLILRLLEANGTRDGLNKIFSQAIDTAPSKLHPQLKEILVADNILYRFIPIYMENFDQQELRELLNFYVSPTGQKYQKLAPQIMEDTMKEAVQYFNDKVRELETPQDKTVQP